MKSSRLWQSLKAIQSNSDTEKKESIDAYSIDTKLLVNVIANLLVNEAEANLAKWLDDIKLNTVKLPANGGVHSFIKPALQGFFSFVPPQIGLKDYLQHLANTIPLTPTDLILMLIYVDKFLSEAKIKLYPTNLHRIILASSLVTCKFHNDIHHSNLFFSRRGGVKNRELNQLELEFLSNINFSFHLSDETFES